MSGASNVVNKDDGSPASAIITPESKAATMMSVLSNAAADPRADPDKIERLYEVMAREREYTAKQAWNASMVQSQREMGPVIKQTKGDKGWYANLAKIAQQVTDVFTRNGMFLSFSEGESGRERVIRVLCDVGHESGHTERRFVDIPFEDESTSKKKILTDIHATGSAFTYGRRYLTLMIGNIPTPDDDGSAAGGAVAEYATPEQVAKIEEFFDADGDENWRAACLDWLKIETFDDLLARDYSNALSGIKKAFEKRQEAK